MICVFLNDIFCFSNTITFHVYLQYMDVSNLHLSYDGRVLNLTDKLQELNIADRSELSLQGNLLYPQ